MDIKPIFITGVYRSGTTLVSRILNNHSTLNVTYDNVHFMRFCYNNFNPITDPSNIEELLLNVKKRVDKRMEIEWDPYKILSTLKQTKQINYAVLYNEIMRSLIQEAPNNRWGEKTMICWSKIPDFLSMFPKGKVIHVIRDTRDVLSSFKKVTNEPGLRYFDAIFTTLDSMEWAHKKGSKLPKNNYKIIKYEDLVNNPSNTIKDISSFLEIDYEESMLNNNFEHRVPHKKWQANTAYEDTFNGVSNISVGKYKEHLSKIEIFFAEMIARNMLGHYDYKLSGTWLTFDEWKELYNLLSDKFISKRFKYWLKTNKGVEEYPSPPPEVYREKGVEKI